eukprot:scaffold78130_cov64-Phaeocystis_antarctica.AAC.1
MRVADEPHGQLGGGDGTVRGAGLDLAEAGHLVAVDKHLHGVEGLVLELLVLLAELHRAGAHVDPDDLVVVREDRKVAKPLRVAVGVTEGLSLEHELDSVVLPREQRRRLARRQPEVPVLAVDDEHRVLAQPEVRARRGGLVEGVACHDPVAPVARRLAHGSGDIREPTRGAQLVAAVQRVTAERGLRVGHPCVNVMRRVVGAGVAVLGVARWHVSEGEGDAVNVLVLDEHHGILGRLGQVRHVGGVRVVEAVLRGEL